MPATSKPTVRRIAGLAAAAILIVFAIAAIAKGIDGQATVHNSLKQEKVVGTPTMTPTAIAAEATKRGVNGLTYPTCSVAGKSIQTGADARCFAQYLRVDALLATGGKTYAEMPRFASEDGKGTNDPALAVKMPNGQPMNNPARQVWVTATTLSTALNTSYMAEQISLFGIAVGGAFGLLGLLLAAATLTGPKTRQPAPAPAHQRMNDPVAA